MQYHKQNPRKATGHLQEFFDTRGEDNPSRLILGTLSVFISILFLLVACEKSHPAISSLDRRATDSIIRATHGIDSLALLQKEMERKGNWLGSIAVLREWDKALRNESRFEEALRVHSEGLRQAEKSQDTLEWVQALNNIRTDYRRMGMLDVAQDCHYRAWILSKECADKYAAMKSPIISL